jgi:hypothetical protein
MNINFDVARLCRMHLATYIIHFLTVFDDLLLVSTLCIKLSEYFFEKDCLSA